MEGEDGLDVAGDSGGAAAKFPQQAPGLQGRHGLLAEGPDAGVRGVDRALTCREPVPPAAEGHSHGAARALVALVRPAGQARLGEGVDDAVGSGGLDVVQAPGREDEAHSSLPCGSAMTCTFMP